MKETIIQKGAEAILIKRDSELIKRRVKKGYRFRELDEKLRRLRTKKEARLLEKSGNEIFVPIVKKVSEFEIEMEFIDGLKLSEYLDDLENWEEVCLQIGKNIGKLHDSGIIHGDLTTSNMIYVSNEKKVCFIDFGLGFESKRVEDKAVDLHLIKQALEAKHFLHFQNYWKETLEGYKTSKNYKEVLKRLEKVEKRGRYRNQG